jgi:hypothetical protein
MNSVGVGSGKKREKERGEKGLSRNRSTKKSNKLEHKNRKN